MGDAYGRQGDLPASECSRRAVRQAETAFIAPATVGHPQWQRRYTRAAFAIQAGALGCLPCLYLVWQHVLPAPLLTSMLSVAGVAAGGRAVLRGWLLHQRRRGRAVSHMLVLGADDTIAQLVERTRRSPRLGWRIDGAFTSAGTGADGATTVAGLPVVGDLDSVAAVALAHGCDAVAVAPTPGWTSVRLQQLAHDLDGSRTALLVDPCLVQRVSGDVQVDGVHGLPLLRVSRRVRPRKLVREAADRVAALLTVAPSLVRPRAGRR